MRRSFYVLFSLWAVLLPGSPQNIQWIRDYGEGMKLAREDVCPMLIDFWSEQCIPCKQADKNLYNDPALIEASRDFVLIRVDIDKNPAVARRFAVEELPMKIILDPWENVLSRVQGSTTKSELIEALKRIPETFEPISDSFDFLEEDPDDVEALFEIAAFYGNAGFASQAGEFKERAERARQKLKDQVDVEQTQSEPVKPTAKPGARLENVPGELPRLVIAPEAASPKPATPTLDLPADKQLKEYLSGLKDVVLTSDQSQLDFLLMEIGQNIEEFLNSVPNTVSTEHMRREILRTNGTVSASVKQDVEYLLVVYSDASGLQRIQEDRTNRRGKPVKIKKLGRDSFVTSGFAISCVIFFPSNQKACLFRYLGRQSTEPYAHLISYTQKPEESGFKGVFVINQMPTTIWTKGIVWVDPNTYQILRMRTELLNPLPQIGLERLTTEILYGEFPFREREISLWLPREVTVTIHYSGRTFRNFHSYSDYRLFTVESHEKHQPLSQSEIPR